MSFKRYKVSREDVEIGIYDGAEIICLIRNGKILESDDFWLEFEGFWEKCRVLGPLMVANEMECLYRLIKAHASVSVGDLARLSRMSEGKVRYYVGFFLWYGVATDVEDVDAFLGSTASMDVSSSAALAEELEQSEIDNPKKGHVFLTERNINFVEGFKSRIDGRILSAMDFFIDAYVELPAADGFDD